MRMRNFRDRHGRGVRGPLFPQSVPRYQTRSQRFDALVLDAYAPLHQRYAAQLRNLDIAIDLVPRMRHHAPGFFTDEVFADGSVPLGRVIPAGIDAAGAPTRPRLVLFRTPIEQRSRTLEDRRSLIHTALVALLANHLNMSPTDIDPGYRW
ncbi:metallopeptidase family protein [Corynebacterium sp.]|uniref:metallopeptidase family protein n=1 Tax=Corynebacterium sp. TaxID=1720 RepID=UPI0026DB7997|nr:metallopeptidase family protein [Corynebacterium sp.]MDO5077233.1 metallopeptidase family protein [Corynebacterium sp.]